MQLTSQSVDFRLDCKVHWLCGAHFRLALWTDGD